MQRTGFEHGLVDLNLPSAWIFVLQVGEVLHAFWTRTITGVAVGDGVSGTLRTTAPVFVEHGHQLEETIVYVWKMLLWVYIKVRDTGSSKSQENGEAFTSFRLSAILQMYQCSCVRKASRAQLLQEELLEEVGEQRRKSDVRFCRWAGLKELTCGEVCTYEISSQMRSDKTMRSCQTRWHGRRDKETGWAERSRRWRAGGWQTLLIERGTWWQAEAMEEMFVCRTTTATCFDKWARDGVTLSLAEPGDGNDHLMKSNNPSGTNDENETTDETRTQIKLWQPCVCVSADGEYGGGGGMGSIHHAAMPPPTWSL